MVFDRPVFLVNAAEQHRVDTHVLRGQTTNAVHEVGRVEAEIGDVRLAHQISAPCRL